MNIDRISMEHYQDSCPVWRVKRVTHGMFFGLVETVLERCNTPLFDPEAVICQACDRGWECDANRLALPKKPKEEV